jgi:hypothetical protein
MTKAEIIALQQSLNKQGFNLVVSLVGMAACVIGSSLWSCWA